MGWDVQSAWGAQPRDLRPGSMRFLVGLARSVVVSGFAGLSPRASIEERAFDKEGKGNAEPVRSTLWLCGAMRRVGMPAVPSVTCAYKRLF